ncbi:hypothetical protein F5148DRAFT_181557 [Russula earlei]|uniref:Uncharacterized protein n=1 Tax=Russula earlei TaxID=71964 RepID=A0ACC0UJZ8_9AGAM|nr:hypothetical protein F5148DRAFT_181557 [Russula earlei]
MDLHYVSCLPFAYPHVPCGSRTRAPIPLSNPQLYVSLALPATASTSPVAAPVLVSRTAAPVASASPTDVLAPPAASSPAQSAIATTPSASSAAVLGLVPATALLPDHAALSLPSLAVMPPRTAEKECTNNRKTKSTPPPQKSRCHNAIVTGEAADASTTPHNTSPSIASPPTRTPSSTRAATTCSGEDLVAAAVR